MNEIDLLREALKKVNDAEEALSYLSSIEEKLSLYQRIERTLYDNDLFLVYKHTDPNGRVYIGITRNLPQTRWNEGAGYESQRKFYKAIQKYGWINFKHEIIDAALTEQEALKLESEQILKTKSYDSKYGYNTRVGSSEYMSSSHESISSDEVNDDNRGNGRGRVSNWVKQNPSGSLDECARALGLALATVNCYWPKGVRRNQKNRYRVQEWYDQNPNKNPLDCSRSLGLGIQTVKKYWPSKILNDDATEHVSVTVDNWVKSHPYQSRADCARELKISYNTVSSYWPKGYPLKPFDQVKNRQRESLKMVSEFLLNQTEESLLARFEMPLVYEDYVIACEKRQIEPITNIDFSKKLLKQFPSLCVFQKKINGKTRRCLGKQSAK